MPLRSWAAQRTERWCCSRGTCDCWTRTGTGWLKKKPNRYKYINTNTTNQVFGQGFTVRSTVYNTSLVQISRGFFFCQSNFWDISLTFSHSITSWHFLIKVFVILIIRLLLQYWMWIAFITIHVITMIRVTHPWVFSATSSQQTCPQLSRRSLQPSSPARHAQSCSRCESWSPLSGTRRCLGLGTQCAPLSDPVAQSD